MQFKGIFDAVLENLLQEAIDKAVKFNVEVFSTEHLAHALLQDTRLLINKPEITQKIIRARDSLSAYLRQAYPKNNDVPVDMEFSAATALAIGMAKMVIEDNGKTHFHADYLLLSLLYADECVAVDSLRKEGIDYYYVKKVIAEKERGLSDRGKAFAELGEILFHDGLTHTMIMRILSNSRVRGQIMVSIHQNCEERVEEEKVTE